MRFLQCIVREMNRIEASPFGRQLERSLSTEAINGDKDLIPRQIRAFKHNIIKQAARRSTNDLQHSMIRIVLSQHLSPRSGEMRYMDQTRGSLSANW